MKKLILLVFSILSGSIFCYGQIPYQLDKDTSRFNNRPLYILKLSQLSTLQTTNMVIKPSDIDSINVFKDIQSENEYGKSGNNGVIVVVLKLGIKLINFDDLLKTYNINGSAGNLPVFIDSVVAYQPKNTYFELTAIKYVKVDNEKGTGIKYISIRTIYPIHRRTEDEIYIRGNVKM